MMSVVRPHTAFRLDPSHRFVLLAPLGSKPKDVFDHMVVDDSSHHQLLAAVQRFRGQNYLADGALRPSDLTPDGRHNQPIDPHSWHVVVQNESGEVVSCARYYSSPSPSFDSTLASRSRLAREPEYRSQVRELVESSIRSARNRGTQFGEVGGWCIAESARKTPHALRSVLCLFALGEILGGTLGFITATTRHSSSSILQRLGAHIANFQGRIMPTYFEPMFDCDMELLQFDTSKPAPKYAAQVTAYQHLLRSSVQVVCSSAGVPTCVRSLHALAERVELEYSFVPTSQRLKVRNASLR